MQITRPLYSLIHSISRRTGLFTRRQCVDVAARVGKELVDMQKAGIKIDRNSCMYAAKKYVPQSDFKLLWGNKEIMESGDSRIKYITEKMNATDKVWAKYFLLLNSIIMPDEAIARGGAYIFAHEFQHYLNDNYTPIRKLLNKMYLKERNVENSYKATKNIEKKYIKPGFENVLRNLLETKGTDIRNKKQLLKYFAENTNITSKKRLDAYIASISRFYKSGKDTSYYIKHLVTWLTILKDEINSYKVEDIVLKYEDKSQNGYMRIVELYKEAVKVLKKELIKTIKCHLSGKVKKTGERNLPSPVF